MVLPVGTLAVAELRSIGAILALAVLLYWSYERFAGEGADPVLRSSMQSDTGTASMLLSGSQAVMAMAGLAAALLLAPVAGGPVVDSSRPVLLGLGGLVVVHWITEKEERE